jgi:hypothetical protein
LPGAALLKISTASLDALAEDALRRAVLRAAHHLRGGRDNMRADALECCLTQARKMRLQQQDHVDTLLALVLDLDTGAGDFFGRADVADVMRQPDLAGHQKLFLVQDAAGRGAAQ